jgi:hypothetical protein
VPIPEEADGWKVYAVAEPDRAARVIRRIARVSSRGENLLVFILSFGGSRSYIYDGSGSYAYN